MQEMNKKDGIQAFYKSSTILVTGATGFIGILLIEKLLRTCPDINKLYILMRPKKGLSIEERLNKMLEDLVFENMKQACPNYKDKIVPVCGDCELPNVGLSDADCKLLQHEVNVIFHCAATVRFDEVLKKAAAINVRAIRDLLRIARNVKNLQAFVHVSTAYSYCIQKKIEEVIYDSPMDFEKLLNLVDTLKEDALDNITPQIIEPWPNAYTFTKAIGENVCIQEGRGLPVCVVRPSMVISTAKEPVPNWTNNYNGPVGAIFGVALGLIHALILHSEESADMVPADFVINSLISAAWYETVKGQQTIKSMQPTYHLHEKTGQKQEITVYNYVSSARNMITWGQFVEMISENKSTPSEYCVWYHFVIIVEQYWAVVILRALVHTLPALFVDLARLILLKKPRMLKAFKKIHKYLDLTLYFQDTWYFSDTNVQKLWSSLSSEDKEVFQFDISMLDWSKTLYNTVPGLRVYVLKDPLDTVPQGRIKYRRLKIMHYTVVCLLCSLLFWVLWRLISLFI